MKKILYFVLLALTGEQLLSCKKASSENQVSNTYISRFQKDSISKYLTPSVSKDTIGVRAKLKTYTLKILKDKSINDATLKSTYYNSTNNCGFIIDLQTQADVNTLRSDPRIDSLVKSNIIKGF